MTATSAPAAFTRGFSRCRHFGLVSPQVAASPKQAQDSACAGLARHSRSGYRPFDTAMVRLNLYPRPLSLATLSFKCKMSEKT